MAIPKSPLLSLGAKGTVGDILTYQDRLGQTIVRKKPVPAQPYTLPQAYQRWRYRDGILYWNTLSQSVKQAWQSAGARYHMTGFALFMRDYLTNLTGVVGVWHLDDMAAGLTLDASKNGNTGTVFGATLAPGWIDHSFLFDGVNDYVDCGSGATLDIVDEVSISLFFYEITRPHPWPALAAKRLGGNRQYQLFRDNLGFLAFECNAGFVKDNTTPLALGQLYHAAVTFNEAQSRVRFYVDGVMVSEHVVAWSLPHFPAAPFIIGRDGPTGTNPLHGYIDQVKLDSREIVEAEVRERSLRRYP